MAATAGTATAAIISGTETSGASAASAQASTRRLRRVAAGARVEGSGLPWVERVRAMVFLPIRRDEGQTGIGLICNMAFTNRK